MNTTALKQARTARITTLWSQRGELIQRRQTEQQRLVALSQFAMLAGQSSWQEAVQMLREAGLLSQKTVG